MKMKQSDRVQFLKAVGITILLSEMYFYPFNGYFRFSAGIIALNLIYLLYNKFSCVKLSMVSGGAIIVLRLLWEIGAVGSTIQVAFLSHVPSLIFYMVFGLLHELRKLNLDQTKLLMQLFLFACIDGIANIAEAAIRGDLSYRVIQLIFLISGIRILIASGIYLAVKANELYIRNSEHQKRYAQLNVLVSNIQTELFYLNKSQKDIEDVMSKSYDLYHSLADQVEYSEKALEISRSVHEIKKDYSRVLAGFNNFIMDFEKEDSMKLKDAFRIIKANTEKLILELKKEQWIDLALSNQDDFSLKNYYALFTMLNNLVINSIEAATAPVRVSVEEYSDPEFIYFSVKDNGIGIESDLMSYLFKPGFTTKFDLNTGKASTGMGLSHVKSTVESLSGELEFSSIPHKCTLFTIKIPKNQLIRSSKDEDNNDH
ncbi:sensor histidine kinase [Fusibacter ferrireducens]|uniref:histidine kinase n=1 Tax=Fusibacter ferrireducens TaxID=2785058 RepID=A0ABR9ZQR4_9FIRM|nr:sensor histidine kinase [Fusibacter ferrireducens]MBF4692661.1 sensor histidine kinase [Fusibacter ferrireducens]